MTIRERAQEIEKKAAWSGFGGTLRVEFIELIEKHLQESRAEGFASSQSACLAIVEKFGNDAWPFPAAKVQEEIRALPEVGWSLDSGKV